MLGFDSSLRSSMFPKSLGPQRLTRERQRLRHFLLDLDPKERLQTDPPLVWKRALERDIIEALSQLSYGKCAFCERQAPRGLRPYRFRPPGHAKPTSAPQDRICYLWLAFNWHNLFPICLDCRPRDPSFFPVRGQRHVPEQREMERLLEDFSLKAPAVEGPRLVEPGLNDGELPWDLTITLDGHLRAGSSQWGITIRVFDLNRSSLQRARRATIDERIELLQKGIVLKDEERRRPLQAIPQFDAVSLFLARVAEQLSKILKIEAPKRPTALISFLNGATGQKSYRTMIEVALETMQSEDSKTLSIVEEVDDAVTEQQATTEEDDQHDSQHPRIGNVSISNYKSLEKISFDMPEALHRDEETRLKADLSGEIPDAPCLLILGENATGKSSILEAIALACLPREARDRLALKPERLTLNPKYMGDARKKPRMTGRIKVDFHGAPPLALTISASKGEITHSKGSKAESRAMPLIFGYGAHRMYGEQNDDEQPGPVDTLFYNNRQLPDPQPWLIDLESKEPADLDEVIAALRHIIEIDGEFRDISVLPGRGDEPARCVINVVKTRSDVPATQPKRERTYIVPQQLDVVSSGYRAVLALVCDVLSGLMAATGGRAREARMAHAIVLIDEIEAHLHPRWKMRIISGLRQALPNVSFIITSHDPLCVRGMMQDEVLVLNRYQSAAGKSGSRLPEVVERVDGFGNIEAWTVEQLLTSDLFQMLSTEADRTDRDFAEVADLLAMQERGEKLLPEKQDLIDAFNAQITEALPYGRIELTRVVREALAEFLKERAKSQGPATLEARKKAKRAVKKFLKDLVP